MVDMTTVTHVVTKDGQTIHAYGSREEVSEIFRKAASAIGINRYGLVRFEIDTPTGPETVDMEYSMFYLVGRSHEAENLHGPGTPIASNETVQQTPDVVIG